MAEERVPAGWYPDPSGLPQLRWWDNHRWTEFVSDSQVEETVEETQPVVETPETIVVTARPALETTRAAEPVHAPADLGHAFDAMFGESSLASETAAEPETPRLAAAFDAAFGPVSADPDRIAEPRFEEPRFVAAEPISPEPLRAEPVIPAPVSAEPLTPTNAADPLETMFASSATSPVGVGTGETIGEALMRALQSA